MDLTNIKNYVCDKEYAWNEPHTYLLLVPGVSLVLQKMQFSEALPLTFNKMQHQYPLTTNNESRKFANICKWHLRGSMTQLIICIIAVKAFSLPLFSLLAILATYEMVDTLYKGLANRITLYEFNEDRSIKSLRSTSMPSIF
jgi:hypothetical protein